MRQLPRLLRRLVRDQNGSTAPMGVILVTSIVSLGSIVGLVTVRDQIVQQFGDAAVALRELRQGYEYRIEIDGNRDGDVLDREDHILSGGFKDEVDLFDDPGAAPACLDLTLVPINESN